MKISLIIATINRSNELIMLFDSLEKQTYRNFEVILVDQNSDNRLLPLINHYANKFSLKHIHSEPGLSRARNRGLPNVSGDIVSFPDDDCWYPYDLLEKVTRFFEINPEYAGVTGKSENNSGSSTQINWLKKPCEITLYNVWRTAISYTIFLRNEIFSEVGTFDESLGVGSGTCWNSGEETDILIRIINSNRRILYNPEFIVYHPEYEKTTQRASKYGPGLGRVLKKHRYPLSFVFYLVIIRPLGGFILSLLKLDIKGCLYYWTVFKGRLKGWLS